MTRALVGFVLLASTAVSAAQSPELEPAGNIAEARESYRRAQQAFGAGQVARAREIMSEARRRALEAVRESPRDEKARQVLYLVNEWNKANQVEVPEQV